MDRHHVERRTCVRFAIPGAVLCYRKEGLLTSCRFTEDFYPVRDISRGGLCFLGQVAPKVDSKLTLKIEVPGNTTPLVVSGRVRWSSLNYGKSYRYQIGVQFAPYGRQKGKNAPEVLQEIIVLEQKTSRTLNDHLTLKKKSNCEFNININACRYRR